MLIKKSQFGLLIFGAVENLFYFNCPCRKNSLKVPASSSHERELGRACRDIISKGQKIPELLSGNGILSRLS